METENTWKRRLIDVTSTVSTGPSVPVSLRSTRLPCYVSVSLEDTGALHNYPSWRFSRRMHVVEVRTERTGLAACHLIVKLSLLTILRDQGLPLPAGAVLISPWVDLTHSFPSLGDDGTLDYIPAHGFLHRP